MKATLRIPRWRDFQHYKDRNAPWIKAYRELLLDDEWHELSDPSKGHLFGLWLLAASYEGKIPFKPNWISRQIGATVAINWRELASSKWVALNEAASAVLAESYQDASLRALAREEGEGEGEEENTSGSDLEAEVLDDLTLLAAGSYNALAKEWGKPSLTKKRAKRLANRIRQCDIAMRAAHADFSFDELFRRVKQQAHFFCDRWRAWDLEWFVSTTRGEFAHAEKTWVLSYAENTQRSGAKTSRRITLFEKPE
jgi:hypothetical protein